MVRSKIIRRFIIIIILLNPTFFLGYTIYLGTVLKFLGEHIKEVVGVSTGALNLLKTFPPSNPSHTTSSPTYLNPQALATIKAAVAQVPRPVKPFPSFSTMAKAIPIAAKPLVIAQAPAAAPFFPQAFIAATREKLVQSATKNTAATIHCAPQQVISKTAAATSSSLQHTMSQVPSQFQKNALITATSQKIQAQTQGNTPPIAAPLQTQAPAITVKALAPQPQGVAADLHKINSAYVANLMQENHRIATNPRLRTLYEMQWALVTDHLKTACNVSITPEIIKAQLTLFNTHVEHALKNADLNYATTKMIEVMSNDNGEFIGCHSSDVHRRLNRFAAMEVSVGDFFKNCWKGIKKLTGLHEEIAPRFVGNPYNINLYNCCEHVINKQVNEAKHFLDTIAPTHPLDGCNKCKIYGCMNDAYIKLYNSLFNEHQMSRVLEQDTLWQQNKAILDQRGPHYLQQLASTQSLLEARYQTVQFLSQKLPAHNNGTLTKILYDIASTYTNPFATVEYLAKLSSDHPEASVREARALIFGSETLPKLYDYPYLQAFKDIALSKDIFLEKYKDLRTTYLKLTRYQPNNELGSTLIRQGLTYTQKALESPAHATIFQNLAYEILSSLADPQNDRKIFSCPDFSTTFADPVAEQIKNRVLPILSTAFGDRHLSAQSTDTVIRMQREYAAHVIDHISSIYQALNNNDTKTALDIEKNVLPQFIKNFRVEELKKLDQPTIAAPDALRSLVTAQLVLKGQSVPQATVHAAPEPQNITALRAAQESGARHTATDTHSDPSEELRYAKANGEQQNTQRNYGRPGSDSPSSMDPEDPDKEEGKPGIKDTKEFKDAEKQIEVHKQRFEKLGLKPLSKKDIKHIINNHTKIGEISKQRSLGGKSSNFKEDIDLIGLILDACEYGKEVEPNVKVHNCEKIIGQTDRTGYTSLIRVCLNKTNDSIKTAFPI